MLMLMTSSRIDTEDPGAVPGASTIDTSNKTAESFCTTGATFVGCRKSGVSLMGAKFRIDWCNKNKIETEANVLDANDNAPIAYRLAA